MRETLEREIKLAPREGFVFPELMGERLPSRVFISTYHDTEDLRLAPYGVTLRHRVEDGTGLWQLKLPRGSARLELELPGQASRPPVELVDLLPAYLRGGSSFPSPGFAPAGRRSVPAAPRSSTTASRCSRASVSRDGSARSRSS